MRWLYEKKSFASEKNGTIRCRRFFGTYTITVDGFYETGPYMDTLWKRSLKKLPPDARIKNILVLGYGGGGINKVLHDRFKNIHITTIEWDPVMMHLAQEVIGFGKYPRPEILFGDAREILPTLHQQYDLILFDLFKGNNIHPDLLAQPFLHHLMRLLDHDGFLLMNAFVQPEMYTNLSRIASKYSEWRYKYNTIALFRHFGLGNAGDPLPAGYIPRNTHPGYLKRNYINTPFELVQNTAVGFRRPLGSLSFEVYKDDRLPTIAPYPHWRIVSWLPLSNTTKPKGWHRDWTPAGTSMTGVATITDGNYAKHWNQNAQRQLKKWKKQTEYHIVTGTAEEMDVGFLHPKNPSYPRYIGKEYSKLLHRRLQTDGDLVHIWVVKHKVTNEAVAGLAVIDIPETSTSLHYVAFTLHGQSQGAGTALIDIWHQKSLQRNLRFMDFDLLATKGDDRSWAGFTRFKKQFNLYLIKRPPHYFKLVPPTKNIPKT